MLWTGGSLFAAVSVFAYWRSKRRPATSEYGRWQATRSAYWRDLYYVCVTTSDTADEALSIEWPR